MANRKLKYMGFSDVRVIEKGEDFGGQLSEPLSKTLVWDWDNKHVIETDDYSDVDDVVWELIAEQPDFRDVTELKRIPTNGAQQLWRAMPKTEEAEEAVEGSTPEPTQTTDESPTTSVTGDAAGAGTATAARGARGRST